MSEAINRMLLHVGTKIETLEACYGIPQPDGQTQWKTEMAKRDFEIMTEIHKTLHLVSTHEAEFKQVLGAKLGTKKKR